MTMQEFKPLEYEPLEFVRQKVITYLLTIKELRETILELREEIDYLKHTHPSYKNQKTVK